jgi:phosphoesterase RecJ-like protein
MSDAPPSELGASLAQTNHLSLSQGTASYEGGRPGCTRAQSNAEKLEYSTTLSVDPWEAAVARICSATSLLLICHVSPDGDAIGSLLGLGLGLRSLDKKLTLACESSLPVKFSFLPGFESIVNTIDSYKFDLVIGLDSSDPLRLGSVYDADLLVGVPLINIDHHTTNLYYGDINLVDPQAASTAEIVLTLLDRLGVSIDLNAATHQPSSTNTHPDVLPASEIATCLLAGIVTDTLGFRTSNVTPKVLGTAMRLMQAGASLSQVTHHAFNQRPLAELELLARGLDRLKAEDGLAWSEITLADYRACRNAVDGDAGLVGMLVRTKEVHMAAVFTERENNQVEISFRADAGFDIAQLALSLGGGGHPAASGCTIEGSLEAAKARVLPMMRTALEEQQTTPKS